MSNKLYTAVARCGTCKREINRAPGVPESKKAQVALGSPMNCFCPVKAHNTLSDLNYNVEIEWLDGLVEV